jgi:hypothetical protein
MDEQKQPQPQEKEPELRRPDDTVKDLAPEVEEGAEVKGGDLGPCASGEHIGKVIL